MTVLQKTEARSLRCSKMAGGAILVGVSGGKDSLVTLDFCTRYFKHVEAYYMYLVPGMRCIEGPIEAQCKRYGVKVHKVPHFDLARLRKFGVYCPHAKGCESLRLLKRADIEKALVKRTGIQWFAYGERASDSFMRRIIVTKDDGIRVPKREAPKFFPIWDWKDANVYGYMKVMGIPNPPRFGCDKASAGFELSPAPLRWLRDNHPDDFELVKQHFPYVEAAL